MATPYVFIIDDDFVVDSHLNLGMLLYVLETAQFDILAVRNPADLVRWGFDFSGKLTQHKNNTSNTLALESGVYGIENGCHVVDIVPNLFLARTQFLKEVSWDPRLKLAEHEEYFLRVQNAGGKVGSCPQLWVCHQWQRTDAYEADRRRQARFFRMALRKHNLTRLISFGKEVAQLMPSETVDMDELICPMGFNGSNCRRCADGFEGAKCDLCTSGHWGLECQPCQCQQSPCSDGRAGYGCMCVRGRHGLHCELEFLLGRNLIHAPIGSYPQNDTRLSAPWFSYEGGYELVATDTFEDERALVPLVRGSPGGGFAQVSLFNSLAVFSISFSASLAFFFIIIILILSVSRCVFV